MIDDESLSEMRVNVETEKYVDPNGRELFLWPWENRLRVDEGDAWLYQFLEYLLARANRFRAAWR